MWEILTALICVCVCVCVYAIELFSQLLKYLFYCGSTTSERFYICCNEHVTSTGAPQLVLRSHFNQLLYLLTCYCSLLLGVGPHPSWVGLPIPAGPSGQCCSGVHMVKEKPGMLTYKSDASKVF